MASFLHARFPIAGSGHQHCSHLKYYLPTSKMLWSWALLAALRGQKLLVFTIIAVIGISLLSMHPRNSLEIIKLVGPSSLLLATPPTTTFATSATLVTAYFPLSQGSKHSLGDYRTWMANFLPHVQAPIVIYLPPDDELEVIIRELRGDLPLIVRVSSAFQPTWSVLSSGHTDSRSHPPTATVCRSLGHSPLGAPCERVQDVST